jgi:hypothetical protein
MNEATKSQIAEAKLAGYTVQSFSGTLVYKRIEKPKQK